MIKYNTVAIFCQNITTLLIVNIKYNIVRYMEFYVKYTILYFVYI